MARQNIHPKTYELTIVMTNGETFVTESAANIGKLILDSDKNTHPAWNGGMFQVNKKVGKVSQFNNKFGDFL
jgi:large subunit ribosomal protein L31